METNTAGAVMHISAEMNRLSTGLSRLLLIHCTASLGNICRSRMAVISDKTMDAIVRVARMRSGIPVTMVRMFSERLCRNLMESA